jgi:salicylate hydroxylase
VLTIIVAFSSGAGIAGLTLAIALNEFDKARRYIIDIYETAPELSEIGAGIMMYPKTLHIMKEIGVSETLLPYFDHPPDEIPRTSPRCLIPSVHVRLNSRLYLSPSGAVFEVRKADHKPHGMKILDVIQNGMYNWTRFIRDLMSY